MPAFFVRSVVTFHLIDQTQQMVGNSSACAGHCHHRPGCEPLFDNPSSSCNPVWCSERIPPELHDQWRSHLPAPTFSATGAVAGGGSLTQGLIQVLDQVA